MIVIETNLKKVIHFINHFNEIGFDVETSGTDPYKGDRLFSLALSVKTEKELKGFYFNFQEYENLPEEYLLRKKETIELLATTLFNKKDKLFCAHSARFDLHMLAQENCFIEGVVHCTKSIGRVVYNEHSRYDLDSSLERIGMEKDPAVEQYIEEHGLWEWITIPGKKQREKKKFYDKVPFEIIMPYAIKDAKGTLALGLHQIASIEAQDKETHADLPKLKQVVDNERRLTKTIFHMERLGCRIDRGYCERAVKHYQEEINNLNAQIEMETGVPFVNSSKHLESILKSNRSQFTLSEKRGYSFDSQALKKINHPLVPTILQIRKAQNRVQFFQGFLYHSDRHDIIHASFNPDVARHGRLSSSRPNLQNLAAEEIEDEADGNERFYVRRAIIPREGNILLMPDWAAFEYRMALEYACKLAGRVVPLAQMVLDGMDFHDATVELVKKKGYDINRRKAKIVNFLTLYEGGPKVLSENIGCSYDEAMTIFNAVRSACPEIRGALALMQKTARTRGWIFNWYGRRSHFPVSRFSYKAGNYVISGGCADIAKIVMNELSHRYGLNNAMIAMVHDELIFDLPLVDAGGVAKTIHHVMENTFPAEYMPTKVDFAWSERSLLDKRKGFPT